ncbi:sensor histidine kinase [Actinocorallia aurea]
MKSGQAWWWRHPVGVDAAVAAASFLLLVGMMRFGSHEAPPRALNAVDWVFAVSSCSILLARRHRPVAVFALVTVLGGLHGWLSSVDAQQILPSLVALYAVTALRGSRWGLGAGACLVLLAGTHAVVGEAHGPPLGAVGLVATTGFAIAAGAAVRAQRAYVAALEERAERAERQRREEAGRLLAEERMRIAGELHDVIAHQLTLINAQAGVALYLDGTGPSDPGRLAETLAHVKDDSKQALTELRAIVGLLGSGPAAREPLPGLAQVDDLAASFALAGLEVEIRREGDAVSLPSAIDLSAYRIIQEALTNVSKHANTDVAWVRLGYGPHALSIRIEDEGTGVGAGGGTGRGLIGMRERACAAGGRVRTGRRPGGGFVVEAKLPLGSR